MLIEALPDVTWKLAYYFLLHLLAAAVAAEAITEAVVENDALDGFRQWVGSKSTTLGLGLMCGRCFSFWASALTGGFAAWSWWGLMGWWALVLPLGAWRLAAVLHDLMSWLHAHKEAILESTREA